MKTTLIIISSMLVFSACYSPKKLFLSEVEEYKSKLEQTSEVYTEDDIRNLPEPVQRYFRYCGYIGKEKPDAVEIVWENSFIKMQPNKKWLKLKTIQFNFVKDPARLAYMKARLL